MIISLSNCSSSKPLSPQIELDYNSNQSDNMSLLIELEDILKKEEINEALINKIEMYIVYKKDYLVECLSKKKQTMQL